MIGQTRKYEWWERAGNIAGNVNRHKHVKSKTHWVTFSEGGQVKSDFWQSVSFHTHTHYIYIYIYIYINIYIRVREKERVCVYIYIYVY